ncbi:MAG TPA: hypothetical protein VFN96_00425 [Gemmatimonadales bacterium]|nr:hypothetical protein [Gemmatimonadales bacterium]
MTSVPRSSRATQDPIPLRDRALEDISFIRDTMARAGTVTSVPGWGGVAMGITALAASGFAAGRASAAEWIAVWLAAAVLALGIGGIAMVRKAEATRTPLLTRAGKLFIRAFVPPVLAGAVLTPVFYQAGLVEELPGVWLLLYGSAVTAAGATSIPVVPLMGMSFMALGICAFLAPAAWGDVFMALGFGGLQVSFGFLIARKHGG